MHADLVVSVHPVLVSVNATRPGVRGVIHKHPIYSLALVKVEAYLSPMASNALLGSLQTRKTPFTTCQNCCDPLHKDVVP